MSTALTRYQSRYTAKKALFSFLGSSFYLYGPEGDLAFFVKQKAFRLKESITVYADEAQQQPMLHIRARSIIDFSSVYDVTDAASGEGVGSLRRSGVKSMFRDEWTLLDVNERELGKAQEDSGILALLRRLFLPIIPQKFQVTVNGSDAGSIHQRFNPFQLGYDVDFSRAGDALDPRLAVATVVLLLAVEGRQE